MTCPHCERYKQSASMWRNKAYELNGTPLPWKPDELWVGLTDEEIDRLPTHLSSRSKRRLYCTIEAKLKEKNT